MSKIKTLTADEARQLSEKVNWDEQVDSKIQEVSRWIEQFARRGVRKVSVDIWSKNHYVHDRVINHFQDLGYEVTKTWSGIEVRW